MPTKAETSGRDDGIESELADPFPVPEKFRMRVTPFRCGLKSLAALTSPVVLAILLTMAIHDRLEAG